MLYALAVALTILEGAESHSPEGSLLMGWIKSLIVNRIPEFLAQLWDRLKHYSEHGLFWATVALVFATLLLAYFTARHVGLEKRKRKQKRREIESQVRICRVRDFEAGSVVSGAIAPGSLQTTSLSHRTRN